MIYKQLTLQEKGSFIDFSIFTIDAFYSMTSFIGSVIVQPMRFLLNTFSKKIKTNLSDICKKTTTPKTLQADLNL